MNTCHWKCLAGLTVVCLIFISGPVPLLADENQDMIDEASREFGKASEATKEAQNNTPQESVRRPENDLDKAAKKNDDVQADPKSTQQQKDDARKAEDAARAKADDARKDYHDPGKAETYRKALEKRREARKNLKIHTPFSGEPKKELESIVQQTVWAANPTHDGNATTKEDLTRTIYKQVKPQTEEQKKALQPGINNIWGAVQLTGKTAKVIVEPGQTPAYELTGAVAKPETITTDAPSGTSAVETSTPSEEKPAPPQTTEKPPSPQPNPRKDEPSIFDGPMQEGAEAARAIPAMTKAAKDALDKARKAQRDAKRKFIDSDPKVKQLREEIDKQTKLKDDPQADDKIKDKYQEKINKAQEDMNKAKGDAEKKWNDSQEKKDAQKSVDEARKALDELEKSKPAIPPDADKMTEPIPQGRVDEKDMGKEGGSSVMPSGVGN